MSSAIYEHAASLWREMHDEWDNLREVQFNEAEVFCRGYMVRKYGTVSNRDMWNRPRAYQRKHGTEELNAWLDAFPKTTLEAFELQWMRGRVFA